MPLQGLRCLQPLLRAPSRAYLQDRSNMVCEEAMTNYTPTCTVSTRMLRQWEHTRILLEGDKVTSYNSYK
jgi:hypothetical protein